MSTSTNLATNVRARFNHHQSRLYLTEKYQNQLTIVAQGGTWTATLELLSFLHDASGDVIVLDDNGRPTKVNSHELYTALLDTYNTVMEEWYTEFAELEKNR